MSNVPKSKQKPAAMEFYHVGIKLKKYRALVDQGRMPLMDAVNAYFSWRGNAVKYDSYNTLANMDELFMHLFAENTRKEGLIWRRSRSTKLITRLIT